MNWKNKVFENFKLVAVTDLKASDETALEKIEAAYRGGVDIIQLRSKTICDNALLRLGQKIRRMADRTQKLFFVNDRPDLAVAADADGVHLGQEDLPIGAARKLFARRGSPRWVGKSTHSAAQARAAEKEGADYIGVGPIFETPTKPGVQAVGLELIRVVRAAVGVPLVAIGGIDEKNIARVLEAGAARIAVVRAIFGQKDIHAASHRLREHLEKTSAPRA